MIEITYAHIYRLTPTLGVTQNMPSIHQKLVLQVPKRFLFLQKEKGVIEKKRGKINAQRNIEKNVCSNQRA
jgi:hypothetical protein